MKKLLIFVFVLLSELIIAQEQSPVQPFLHEIFSQFPAVRDFTMSDAEDEAYFTVQSMGGEISVIMGIKKDNSQWGEPFIMPFSGKHIDLEPFLSPEGLKLFFVSKRPVHKDSIGEKDFDIWYVQRAEKGETWSDPLNLGTPINSMNNEYYPSIAQNRNIYFTSDRTGSKGKDDLFMSVWKGGTYSIPVSLSDAINSDGYEFNGYIAPDESYLIFGGYNRPDGVGSGDLYISYRRPDNSWKQAINLGPKINSDKIDYCPFVGADGSTLYFTSKRVLLDLPNDGFSSLSVLLAELNKYENGSSRIYQVSMDDVLMKNN
jgi:Tol biopolymer transport system component